MTNDYKLNIDDEHSSANFKIKLIALIGKTKELIWKIPRKLRIVLSIILFTIIAITGLNAFKPEAQKRTIPETVVRVDVIETSLTDYPIVVTANGTIEAETRGNLVAQIRGEIISMSDDFKTGGAFQKGDALIQIDPRDYQAALSQAMAAFSQADAAYRQERANAKQAVEDWRRLGNLEEAPALVQRQPQLAAAKAQLDSAKAAHETANLNLSRTQITAPYTGRVIRREAVLGQYLSVGTPIAEVFATDGVEVRLPISQAEFSQLGLDQFDNENGREYKVGLNSKIGNNLYHWKAKITRTDSTFDINTRQIDVIAKVQDPFISSADQAPLKIGQFVNARIQGQTVENVFVIPNKSIREGSYTYVVRDGRLTKQDIEIIWQDDQNTLVSSGVADGDLIVTTSLNSTLAGAKVKLSDEFIASTKSSSVSEPSEDKTLADKKENDTKGKNSEADAEASVGDSKAGTQNTASQ